MRTITEIKSAWVSNKNYNGGKRVVVRSIIIQKLIDKKITASEKNTAEFHYFVDVKLLLTQIRVNKKLLI